MESQKHKRIVILGETAGDVQGVFLREEIEKIAKRNDIKGKVRNVKGEPRVEIICEADKADVLYEKICKLKGFKIKSVEPPTDQLFNIFNDFSISRADDLSEMVWGLQGAGKVFEKASKESELKRNKSMKRGLELAINSITDNVDKMETKKKPFNFRVFCIENFLAQPPSDADDDLIENLRQLLNLCHETNCMIEDKINPENTDFSENLENIRKLAEKVENNLKSGEKD